jgi:hypothetical protein
VRKAWVGWLEWEGEPERQRHHLKCVSQINAGKANSYKESEVVENLPATAFYVGFRQRIMRLMQKDDAGFRD